MSQVNGRIPMNLPDLQKENHLRQIAAKKHGKKRDKVQVDQLNRAAMAILNRKNTNLLWTTNSNDEVIEDHINDDGMYLDASVKFESMEILR